jgi:hypothetical protein
VPLAGTRDGAATSAAPRVSGAGQWSQILDGIESAQWFRLNRLPVPVWSQTMSAGLLWNATLRDTTFSVGLTLLAGLAPPSELADATTMPPESFEAMVGRLLKTWFLVTATA